jgi:hypothetical protein
MLQQPAPPLPALPQAIEHYVDPRSGQRMQRRLIGACLSGRLLIHRSKGVADLLWCGDDIAGALDWLLKQMMAQEPIATRRPGIWWLARLPLPPTAYLIDDKGGGGSELFELTACWVRRPGAAW